MTSEAAGTPKAFELSAEDSRISGIMLGAAWQIVADDPELSARAKKRAAEIMAEAVREGVVPARAMGTESETASMVLAASKAWKREEVCMEGIEFNARQYPMAMTGRLYRFLMDGLGDERWSGLIYIKALSHYGDLVVLVKPGGQGLQVEGVPENMWGCGKRIAKAIDRVLITRRMDDLGPEWIMLFDINDRGVVVDQAVQLQEKKAA